MNPVFKLDAPWLSHSNTPKSLRITAAALAFGVHALFVVLMLLSVNWKTQDAAPVAVEMWTPAEMAPVPQPDMQPPAPVQQAPTTVPLPVPQAVLPAQPDIALAQQREQQDKLKRKAQEKLLQEKLVQEKLVQERLAQQAQIRQAQLAQQKIAAGKRKVALQKLMAQQTASELSSQSERALNTANQFSRQQAGMMQEFEDKIKAKIRGRIILPEGLQGNPEAIFIVTVLPSGEVVQVSLQHSSGQPVYDDAVRRAILKASPLPMPPDAVLAGQFRELNLHFSPQDH
ncbi:MAG: cell envelope integrity protein TolA [Betaproteobacteria bacterium]|nr:cell envelope integrity protein TolA [Betaproteobacteria bacterium]